MNKNSTIKVKNIIYILFLAPALFALNLNLFSAATIVSDTTEKTSEKSKKLGLKLIKAVKKGDKLEIMKLISEGADLNVSDIYKHTSLMEAVEADHYIGYTEEKNSTEIMQLLINAGANVNNTSRDTPLMLAARCGDIDKVKLLIENGADVNFVNCFKDGALKYAVNVNLTCYEDIEAAEKNCKDIAQLLINAGANIDVASHMKWTPLIYACVNCNKTLVSFLLDLGCDIDNIDLRSALNYASNIEEIDSEYIKKTKPEIFKLLTSEPKRRALAQERRKSISDGLTLIKELPPVLIALIDSYIPKTMAGVLSDYQDECSQYATKS